MQFVPEWGRNRTRGMLEARPTGASRVFAWGLSIPAFFAALPEHPQGLCLMTAASVRAVAKVSARRSDAWFTLGPAELFKHYDPAPTPSPPPVASVACGSPLLSRRAATSSTSGSESGSELERRRARARHGRARRQAVLRRPIPKARTSTAAGSSCHPAVPSVTGKTPFKTLFTHGFMVDKDGAQTQQNRGRQRRRSLPEVRSDVLHAGGSVRRRTTTT